MEELFNNFGSLFEVFSWWSLLLVVGTTAIMIPINLLWKKVMKKDELQRLRKITSSFSVYVVAIALVSIFTAIVDTSKFSDLGYLFGSTISLGFCSQVLWAVIKVVKDYGWKGIVAIMDKVNWSKAIKSLGEKYNLDVKLIDYIATEIETNYLSNIDTTEAEALLENELAIVNDIKKKLEGFTAEESIGDVAKGIYETLKDAWKDSKTSKTQEEQSVEVIEESTTETENKETEETVIDVL